MDYNGGGYTLSFGSGDDLFLTDSLGDWDLANGSSGTINLTDSQVSVFGGDDTINFTALTYFTGRGLILHR